MGENTRWPSLLAMMAAAGRNDGGVGLSVLVSHSRLSEPPAMKIIITRETIVPRSHAHDPG